MPWGWECRTKLVKQLPAKPTEHRHPTGGGPKAPGPDQYELPQIFCGKGFCKIKRAPAYSFGHLTKAEFSRPVTTSNAPMFNVQGVGRYGPYKITHSVVTPAIKPPLSNLKIPGPGTYVPHFGARYKRPPAYSLRPAAQPPYQAWDQWTPPPNMYCPPIPCKKPPAYTLGYMARSLKQQDLPGPGEHEPNFNYVKRSKPAYTFGPPYRDLKPTKTPAPNTYCEKKFMVSMRSIPAPSFGIRHSPHLGKREVYLRSSSLDIQPVGS